MSATQRRLIGWLKDKHKGWLTLYEEYRAGTMPSPIVLAEHVGHLKCLDDLIKELERGMPARRKVSR